MLPSWLFVLVAAAIAVTAFGVGQLAPGLGVAFAALASTLWTAYVANRQRRLKKDC